MDTHNETHTHILVDSNGSTFEVPCSNCDSTDWWAFDNGHIFLEEDN